MYLNKKQEKALELALEAMESFSGKYLDDEEYNEVANTITDMLGKSREYKRKKERKK